MRRVLITGATGFIGTQAVSALARRGFEIVGVSSRARPGCQDGVQWLQGDLLEPGVAERVVNQSRPTHLLHCAWYGEPGKFWNAPENFAWIKASSSLLRSFAAAGGVRALTVGSSA